MCINKGESQKYSVEQMHRRAGAVWFHVYGRPEQGNLCVVRIDTKVYCFLHRGSRIMGNVLMKLPGVTEIVYILIRVWATYVYPFIKTHQSVHIESRISLYINNTSVKNKLLCISLKSYLFLYLFSFLGNGQMPQELC